MSRADGGSARGAQPWRNIAVHYGKCSRRAGSAGETRTPATCENGLISEDFGESSSCNSIVNKSIIVHLTSSQLIKYFRENEPSNPTPEERTTSYPLFRSTQGWIDEN